MQTVLFTFDLYMYNNKFQNCFLIFDENPFHSLICDFNLYICVLIEILVGILCYFWFQRQRVVVLFVSDAVAVVVDVCATAVFVFVLLLNFVCNHVDWFHKKNIKHIHIQLAFYFVHIF